jgi:hypothetical protein|tara:strand:+ start:3139 stop:3339 length:201 start_codon:yes stop_codon:yes gene_type:complete
MKFNIKFEEFLQGKFMELEPEVLDDDLPDAFDEWLGNIPNDKFIKYGDEFARQIKLEIAKEVRKII